MKFGAIQIKDRLGREVILRSAEIADADALVEYLKITTGETPYLIREPEEVTITLEQEKSFIESKINEERELMLVATIDGKHIGNCSLMSLAPYKRYAHRCEVAIALYQDGYVRFLIFTGGIGDGDSISEAQAAKNYALAMGIPETAIFIEENSHITEENMENAKRIMDAQHLQTALIVSDPLHMKRAMLMAQDYGITAYTSPTQSTMYQTSKTKLPFLAREIVMYIGYSCIRIFR